MGFQQPQPTRHHVIAVECKLSRRRCAELVLADHSPHKPTHRNAENLLAASGEASWEDLDVRIEFRIVISQPESMIDVYFRSADQVGDPYWANIEDGIDIGTTRMSVWLYRRVIIAEILRCLLTSSQLSSTTTASQHVVNLGDLTPS